MEIDAPPVVVLAASPQLLTCAVACVEHCDAGDEQAKEIGEPIRMSSQWLSERWSRSEIRGRKERLVPWDPQPMKKSILMKNQLSTFVLQTPEDSYGVCGE